MGSKFTIIPKMDPIYFTFTNFPSLGRVRQGEDRVGPHRLHRQPARGAHDRPQARGRLPSVRRRVQLPPGQRFVLLGEVPLQPRAG